jgi:hypothetical protein
MKYVGEYIMGPRDGYAFRYQLGRLELLEVSLPLYQVIKLVEIDLEDFTRRAVTTRTG